MDVTQPKALLAMLAFTIGASILISRSFNSQQDSREPPLAPTRIPILGHAIGLMRRKFNYYVDLSNKTGLPILTLPMPGQKMYIVLSSSLIQLIQKQPKVLAFPPIEGKFASKVCGLSKEADEIVMRNINADDGEGNSPSLGMEVHDAMRSVLSPGKSLDEMNEVMIESVGRSLEIVVPKGRKSTTVNLAEWLKGLVTKATTEAVYGNENPFRDPVVEFNFWEFENNLFAILIGILPSIFASTGIAARDHVALAFYQYIQRKGQDSASDLMQVRYALSSKHGVSDLDTARCEVGGTIAIVVNTAPASFWMIFYVYSHPGLLKQIREELDSVIETTIDANGDKACSLNITSVKTSCPLLMSTFQEVLRFRSMGTSVRQVMADTILDNKYLLKKDTMIQMPSRVIHTDASVWGRDAMSFEPRRFLKDYIHKTENGKKPPATAFRAFGGGTTLCPGRHFATNEILAVVAMCVCRFDVVPANGKWEEPKSEGTNAAAVIMQPDTDIGVKVSVKDGADAIKWAFKMGDSKIIFAVVDEDRTV